MAELNCMSLNARGLRDGKKRREIFRWLKRYYNARESFVFLQETHSSEEDHELWKTEWGGDIVYAHGTTSARGCAILCPSNLSNFEFIDKWNDNEGRICVLNMKVNNELHCLINIYAPTKNNHKSQLDLLDNLEEVIHKNENASLIIGGDFNTYLDPILDKDGGSFEPLSKYSNKLQKLMEDFQLCDIWRCLHPINRRYT